MKILHIGKYYPPFHGGMENFLDDLAMEQVRRGNEVKVLCHQHEKGKTYEEETFGPGLEVLRVPIMGVAAYVPVAPGFYRALKNILDAFQPDIVHVHMPNASAFWLLLIKKDFKLVIHWHSDVVSSENDWKLRTLYPFYRIFEKRLLVKTDQVIVTSCSYLDTSLALRRFREKCRVIPLGLSLEKLKVFDGKVETRIDSGRINDQLESDDEFVFSVGRFTYYKGFEYLIRACQEGYGGKLIIAGDGPLRPGLMDLALQLGLEDRVIMPGKVDNYTLFEFFDKCTAFCLPSIERTEAFGMVLLEAMSHAKPLITTRVKGSGMNEVNIHKETGLAVLPADAKALAEAMQYMLDHGDRPAAMGEKGRKRLMEHFVISRVAREIEKVY